MIKAGDRVRLKRNRNLTGTVDEVYEEDGGRWSMVPVVWDKSGCIGDAMLDSLEVIPNEEDR